MIASFRVLSNLMDISAEIINEFKNFNQAFKPAEITVETIDAKI